jgi:[ribosomal protein S18]-alanine N-acetyltransferase
MGDPCRIRPARAADAPVLAALERECFADPWSEASFREALASPFCFGLIAASVDGRALGYLLGRDVAGSGEILNLAVAPAQRRRGIARVLLDSALEWFAERRSAEVYLEVRESNGAAQALYRAAGFEPIGRRGRYYRQPTEDALVLRLAMPAQA